MSFLGDVFGSFVSSNPIGMAIGLGSSLLGGVLGNKSQKEANQMNLQIARENNQNSMDIANMNNAFQWRALNANNDFNRRMAIEMFNMENAYNTPLQQVARLREAGINPALYFAGGGASAGTANASTPQAASSGISPSMPSLSTPHMDAVPNVVSGTLSALTQLAQVSQLNASARKAGAETSTLEALLEPTVRKTIKEIENIEAQTNHQRFMNEMDYLYESSERKYRVRNLIKDIAVKGSQITTLASQGKLNEAQALLAEVERMFTNSRDTELKTRMPYIVPTLKAQIDLYQAQEEAAHEAAGASRAQAHFTIQQAERIKEARPVLLEIDKLTRDDMSNKKYEFNQTIGDRIKMVTLQMKLQGKELERIDALIERSKKENNIFYLQQAIHMLREISDGVSNYIPAKGAASSPNAGYTIGYGLPDTTY